MQNLGIGTRLTTCAVQLADALGYDKIWLPVDATNVRARHIYAKCGFEYVAQDSGRELDMCLDLAQRRTGLLPLVPAPHYPTSIERNVVNPGSLGK
jgi:RimJ/RimL family protein N-acetyltransferase